MESTHQNSEAYYKKLETELNKRIHAQTNNRKFTIAFGNAMEAHVKRLRIHKRLTTKWLNRLDLPNKDEISAISVRIVDYEGKLDLMDETIYWMNKRQQENRNQLKMVRKSWESLLSVLEIETRETQTLNGRIKNLETELLDLKQLFQNDNTTLEEKNNGEKN
jgi:hypothetical protein